MNQTIKRYVKIGQWLLLGYAILGIGLYHLQDSIIFHPKPISRDAKIQILYPLNDEMQMSLPIKEWTIVMNAQDTIAGFRTADDSVRKPVLLFFPDSRGNASEDSALLVILYQLGYEVWAMDYPGFGKSAGSKDEKALLNATDQFLKLASTGKNKDSVFFYGKGFGTALAAYAAAYFQPRALCLETPFYSMPSLLGQYACIYPVSRMSTYQLPVNQWMKEVKSPVLMISRNDDDYALKSEFRKLTASSGGQANILNWKQSTDLEMYLDKDFHETMIGFLK